MWGQQNLPTQRPLKSMGSQARRSHLIYLNLSPLERDSTFEVDGIMEPLLLSAVVAGSLAGVIVRVVSTRANLSSVATLGLVIAIFVVGSFASQWHVWQIMSPNDPAWSGPALLLSWIFALGASSLGLIAFAIVFALAKSLAKSKDDG